MLSLKGCSIHVDQPAKKYTPGQPIQGHVQISFDSPTRMRALLISYTGEAHTSWSEQKDVKDSEGKTVKETVHYTGDEEYFRYEFAVVGNKHNGEVTLPAGQYTYPISYTLPPNLPSSFDGIHGHIRYTLSVTLDRPWKMNKSTYITFEIIQPPSICTDVAPKKPYTLQLEKTFCCCCCRSGPLSLNVTIPYTVFSPGQKIPFIIDCDNASNVNVNNIVLTFTKHLIFYAQHPSHTKNVSRVPINKKSVGNVPAHSSKNISEELQIPFIETLNLDACRIIDLLYDINVEGQVAGAHVNLNGTINIKIADLPGAQEIGFSSPNSYPTPPNEGYTNVPLQAYTPPQPYPPQQYPPQQFPPQQYPPQQYPPQQFPPQQYPPQAYSPQPYKNDNITTPPSAPPKY